MKKTEKLREKTLVLMNLKLNKYLKLKKTIKKQNMKVKRSKKLR